MPPMRRLFATLLALAPLAASLGAQPTAAPSTTLTSFDPRSVAALRWRMVGPSRGGRVTTVTGVPSQPHTFYMGVASGGVFRTTDGGGTWVPITDGKVP